MARPSKAAMDAAGCAGTIVGKTIKITISLLDDLLLVAGCACILYGLSMWNEVLTWIAGGLMLVGLAVLVGKAKVRDAAE